MAALVAPERQLPVWGNASQEVAIKNMADGFVIGTDGSQEGKDKLYPIVASQP